PALRVPARGPRPPGGPAVGAVAVAADAGTTARRAPSRGPPRIPAGPPRAMLARTERGVARRDEVDRPTPSGRAPRRLPGARPGPQDRGPGRPPRRCRLPMRPIPRAPG